MIAGIPYHCEVRGTGEALVLLHGFTGSGDSWRDHVETLSRSRRVITVDLPGHGQTNALLDPRHYQAEFCVRDLHNTLQQFEIRRFDLLGYSMGGRLALCYALNHPELVHSLILESASPGIADPVERAVRVQADNALADRIEHDGIPSFVEYWENIPLFESQKRLPAEIRQRVRDQRLKNEPHGLANSLRRFGAGEMPSLWCNLNQISIPTLILAGELDTKYVTIAHEMSARIKNARVEIVSDSGHTIHLEQPLRFQQIVSSFLGL